MRGLWRACLLKASLEADGYYVELEPTVEHDGTPGHIDLYFEGDSLIGTMALNYPVPKRLGCVVEFKATNQAFHVKGPHEPNKDGSAKWYQIVQLMKYCAAKGVEDGAIVTISPSFRDAPMRADWFRLSEWQYDVALEYDRLSAALGDEEPVEDAREDFRCRGCQVVACVRNPAFDNTAEKLERSLAI
jgi:hypothetical protein